MTKGIKASTGHKFSAFAIHIKKIFGLLFCNLLVPLNSYTCDLHTLVHCLQLISKKAV